MGAAMAAFEALFGKELLCKEGGAVVTKPTAELLAGKTHVMIYFSAHWCPHCRGYTPQLSADYAKSPKAGKEVAVVFVSSDKDEASFQGYYGEMSFYALPFADRAKQQQLGQQFGVRGIPFLALLDGEGNVVEGAIRGKHDDY